MIKHTLLAILCVVMFASCKSTYEFYQVFETKPDGRNQQTIEKGGVMQYEDDYCMISYYMWTQGGNPGFEIYNKTEEIIHVDLAECFFILNGTAYDYYIGKEWNTAVTRTKGSTVSDNINYTLFNGNTSSVYEGVSTSAQARIQAAAAKNTANGGIVGIAGSFGVGASSTSGSVRSNGTIGGLSSGTSRSTTEATSRTSSEIIKEKRFVSIPPYCSKFIGVYTINNTLYHDCGLEVFPNDSSTVRFNKFSSPLNFSNYITYTVGDTCNKKRIQNGFYVSSITNYAMPFITKFVPALDECADLKKRQRPMLISYFYKVWRNNVNNMAGSFYIEYSTVSRKKYYKKNGLVYNPKYGVYTNRKSKNKGMGDLLFRR